MSGLVINTNTAANIAAMNLNNNNTSLQSSLQKLSSGLQINSAADNPAGLVISQQFQAQIAGVTQATSNDQQAINMVQTSEGALDEMNNLLNSARQLAIDAANTGVNDPASLAADQAELDNINSSIDSIAKNTQFNSKNLLDGTLSNSQIVNSQEVTNFTSTGLKTGTYGIQIVSGDAGVIATGAQAGLSSQNEAALFGLSEVVSPTSVSALTLTGVFTATTTINITSGVTSQAVAVQVTSGTTIQAALAQLNAAANGISVTFQTGVAGTDQGQASFTIAASQAGDYANGATFTMTNALVGGTYGGQGLTSIGSGSATYAGPVTAAASGALNGIMTGVAAGAQSGSTAILSGSTLTLSIVISGDTAGTGGPFTVTVGSGVTLAQAVTELNALITGVQVSFTNTGGAPAFVMTATVGGSGYAGLVFSGISFSVSGTSATGTAATASTGAGITGGAEATAGVAGVASQALLVTSGGVAVFSVAATSHQGGTFVFPVSSSVPASTGTATITTTNSLVQTSGVYTDAVKVDLGAVFQIGGNQGQTASVTIQNMSAINLGLNSTGTSTNPDIATVSMQTLTNQQYLVNGNAQDAIQVIDKAINDVTTTRGALGAFQTDTLQSTLNSLNTANENLTSAESTIQDTDFASESATFTKENILVQASTAMLAQANQLPQGVLKLLG